MARKRASRDEWSHRVQEWQQSGLSREAYARRKNLNPRSLSWWRWKLAQDATEFVELTVASCSAERIEVLLSNGRVVRVPAEFDDATLARVISTAEAQ